MTHFNHPREITFEAAQALELFVDHGIPVFNQMVLLNGVNNHPALVQALSRRLLFLRAKPYYMFQCDPSEGTDHLRTSVEDSLEIQRALWGKLSGLAMPNLSLDIPDGGGKAGLVPNFELSNAGGTRKFKGWDGIESEYRNPAEPMRIPLDAAEYQKEWTELLNGKRPPLENVSRRDTSSLET
jgi:lysine 2,3-aminomutase